MIRQIILITDGCSNVGISPVIAAAHARAEDIVVNVVGLVDQGEIGKHGTEEIEEIAKAGGGMSRIVDRRQLSQTVQMMTRRTVSHTIQQAVQKELQHIMGSPSLSNLPPGKRAEVVHVMDELGETAALQVALLVDSSASMKPKLSDVEEAIRDLILSLQARQGTSEASIFHFPGSSSGSDTIEMDVNWTRDLAKLTNLFYKLKMKGTTPTGPALLQVVKFFTDEIPADPMPADKEVEPQSWKLTKDGVWSDYIV